MPNAEIVGLFGRFDDYINAISAVFRKLPKNKCKTEKFYRKGMYGSTTGTTFDDFKNNQDDKVKEIIIWHGDWIDGIQFFYDKDEKNSKLNLHGAIGGKKECLSLNIKEEKYEYIRRIRGTFGSYTNEAGELTYRVNQIRIETNNKRHIKCGKYKGEYEFDLYIPDTEIIGLFGRATSNSQNAADNCINAIGAIFRSRKGVSAASRGIS